MQNIDLGKLILRIIGGGFMLTHGIPKLMKLLSGDMGFGDPIGLGPEVSLVLTVFAEFLCAAFILVGFKAKWATVPLMITMLVAAFIVHGSDPWGKKELALLYFAIYTGIFFLGSGKYSIDNLLHKKVNTL
jgi:putative oxidoreductase